MDVGISYARTIDLGEPSGLISAAITAGPQGRVSLTMIALAAEQAGEMVRSADNSLGSHRSLLYAIYALLDRALAAPDEALSCAQEVVHRLAEVQ